MPGTAGDVYFSMLQPGMDRIPSSTNPSWPSAPSLRPGYSGLAGPHQPLPLVPWSSGEGGAERAGDRRSPQAVWGRRC